MNEDAILEKIRQWCKITYGTSTILGVGDDAAVIQPSGRPLFFCSDLSIENVHFDFAFSSPADVAYKAIVRPLSDLAAMAAQPLGVTISIALPKSWPPVRLEKFLEDFYEGAVQCACEFKTPIVGGDLTRADSPLTIDVAAIGETREHGNIWKRSGAKAGDLAFVTGPLGLAAFALQEMKTGKKDFLTPEMAMKHLRPRPRFDAGSALTKLPVTAAIDISDGLISDALRLCKESDLSLALNDKRWNEFELHGGDDYELLLAIDPLWSSSASGKALLRDLGIYEIGQFKTRGQHPSTVLRAESVINPMGHDSFRDT